MASIAFMVEQVMIASMVVQVMTYWMVVQAEMFSRVKVPPDHMITVALMVQIRL